MLKSGDQIELEIARLSSGGGRGVGRHEGLVVFVPDAAPNERVLVRIARVKKNFAEGRLLSVLRPSPSRVTPPCPVAHLCGGCSWQHITYEEQLGQKRNIVEDAVRKFSGRPTIEVKPVIASPQPWHYRNRIQVHSARGRVGFHRRGSHEIIDVENCLIADIRLNVALRGLRARFETNTQLSSRTELTLTEGGEVRESHDPRYEDELGFAQVNTSINTLLIQAVLSHIPSSIDRLLDLYAGAGNFTFPLARHSQPGPKIIAVELHEKSVMHGRAKAERLGASNVQFVNAPVEAFLTSILRNEVDGIDVKDIRNSVVLIDPPRAGCAPEALAALRTLAPKRLIYISCDPVTLARDLGQLPSEVFGVVEVQPFDMFPQTDHVETLAVIDRL